MFWQPPRRDGHDGAVYNQRHAPRPRTLLAPLDSFDRKSKGEIELNRRCRKGDRAGKKGQFLNRAQTRRQSRTLLMEFDILSRDLTFELCDPVAAVHFEAHPILRRTAQG